ncbi:MAG TPA: SDR family oxidoreductase [Glaciihabitans sp.]|jgi:uncharacterized protein YbjT (DUF2867 family)|nr:SDR family oxidoreductase [Glaciihabitans sp.]
MTEEHDNTVPLAITGATGAVGGMVAAQLAGDGICLRLLVRNPDKAPSLPGSSLWPSSYSDKAASIAALTGVQTLFMVSAAENAKRLDQHREFIDSAVAAGVSHIVYTSFAGASPTATFTLARDHYATEEYIKASGLGYTFLRDNLYLDFASALVGEDGVIRGPAGQGRVAMVARADVARTAGVILRNPAAHLNQTYTLTGPEALTLTEVAAQLSAAHGTEVSFYNEDIAEAYASRQKWGAPAWQLDAWVSTYTAIASGELSEVTSDVQKITGVSPLSLTELVTAKP